MTNELTPERLREWDVMGNSNYTRRAADAWEADRRERDELRRENEIMRRIMAAKCMAEEAEYEQPRD